MSPSTPAIPRPTWAYLPVLDFAVNLDDFYRAEFQTEDRLTLFCNSNPRTQVIVEAAEDIAVLKQQFAQHGLN